MTSCLVAKLSHYLPLADEERAFLARMEGTHLSLPRRSTVIGGRSRIGEVFVVREGWLYAHTTDVEGQQIITELFHPGDVVGISQLGCELSTLVYTAATDLELCPFPKEGLRDAFAYHPRLAALFFTFVTLERVSMLDRLRASTSMNPRDRVALFLLQTRARQRITGRLKNEWFLMPLSQQLIGNIVGLSIVSVNRALRVLEDQGHLARDGRMMSLRNHGRLAEEVDFTDRDYAIDCSWFPDRAVA